MRKVKKIVFVTSSRADFGIMSSLINKLRINKLIDLNIIAIGSHLLSNFGSTVSEINIEKRKLHKLKINFETKNPTNITEFCSNLFVKISKKYKYLKPDLVLLLGDRYEILIASFVASIFKIPIVHFCGGDITTGSYDDKFRNAITQLSEYHFTTNNLSKNRVINLIGSKKNVFNFGHMSVDNQTNIKSFQKEQIEKKFKIKIKNNTFLITFHSLTNEKYKTEKVFVNLLKALDSFKDFNYIFTSPNADHESQIIDKMIKKFIKRRKNSFYIKSFGRDYYFSILKFVVGVVGNSSSGILEVPSFKKGVINIGNRQNGRVFSKNIISSNYKKENIKRSLKMLLSSKFKSSLKHTKNFYYKKNAIKNSYKKILLIMNALN